MSSLKRKFDEFQSTVINFQVEAEPKATANTTANKAVKSSVVRTSPENSITKTVFSCHEQNKRNGSNCLYSHREMPSLQSHLERSHGLYLCLYACRFCDQRFIKASARNAHESSCLENRNGKYKCQYCCFTIGVGENKQDNDSSKRQLSLHKMKDHLVDIKRKEL